MFIGYICLFCAKLQKKKRKCKEKVGNTFSQPSIGAFFSSSKARHNWSGQDVPFVQLTDALQVSVTTSQKEYLLDDIVLVGCHVNHF